MSIESTDYRPSANPVIENELPTYRAVSALAVCSLLLGVLSILSFANLTFVAAGVGAVVSGALALSRIKKFPEMLTGKGLANIGLGLGLICTLAAITSNQMQSYLLNREIKKFGEEYAKALETGELAQAIYYFTSPSTRADKKPAEVLETMRMQMREPGQFESLSEGVRKLQERITSKSGHHVHYQGVERKGYKGLDPEASLLLMVDGPTSEKFPEEVEYALVVAHGSAKPGGKVDWTLEQVVYPYTEGSVANEVESAHGHAH